MDDLASKTAEKLTISNEPPPKQPQQAQKQQQQTQNDTPTHHLPILTRSTRAATNSQTLRDVSPVCVIVVGMAGSGKTTLTAALQRSLAPPPPVDEKGDGDDAGRRDAEEEEGEESRPVGYCLNLDPATKLVPFGASIDIRDTVNYKQVMKQHNLGPNGAIMTSLNLFATKFDQVLTILEKRAFTTLPPPSKEGGNENDATTDQTPPPQERKNLDYILVDTPGQIEAFTWSASGSIITSALSSSFPTVLAFVVDTPRCIQSLDTFMSNMLYACSMFYRTRLPLVVVFNKTDVVGCEVCLEWMDDYEKFQSALDEFMDSGRGGGYYATLTRSLSLVLDEFYTTLKKVGVSAGTGDGVAEFWDVVGEAADDFDVGYVGDLRCRVEEKGAKERAVARDGLRRLKEDVEREG